MDFVGFIRVVDDFVRFDVFLFFWILIIFDFDIFLIVVFKLINRCGEVIFKVCSVIMRVSMDLRGWNGSGF